MFVIAIRQVTEIVSVLLQPEPDYADTLLADLGNMSDEAIVECSDFFRCKYLAPEELAQGVALHGTEAGLDHLNGQQTGKGFMCI